ncbi:hypothetical protein LIA77_10877 [Sarocladium implicatum]|nr:hypothetical protein LIA77_10877 [Sarocladium implicatum]
MRNKQASERIQEKGFPPSPRFGKYLFLGLIERATKRALGPVGAKECELTHNTDSRRVEAVLRRRAVQAGGQVPCRAVVGGRVLPPWRGQPSQPWHKHPSVSHIRHSLTLFQLKILLSPQHQFQTIPSVSWESLNQCDQSVLQSSTSLNATQRNRLTHRFRLPAMTRPLFSSANPSSVSIRCVTPHAFAHRHTLEPAHHSAVQPGLGTILVHMVVCCRFRAVASYNSRRQHELKHIY